MIAGIIVVAVFISLLILIHEAGHFIFAKIFKVKVEEFGLGFPPRLWSKKIGETVYSFNALPFGGFVKIFGETRDANAETDPASFVFKKIWKRGLIILGGVMLNFILGWILFFIVFSVGTKPGIIISLVAKNSPAHFADIKPGDKIISAIFGDEDLAPKTSRELIEFINLHRGKEIALSIQRLEKTIAVKVVPRENPPANEGALGIVLSEIGNEPLPLPSSLKQSLVTSLSVLGSVFENFYHFAGQIIKDQKMSGSLVGPVGIIAIAVQAQSVSFTYFLHLMAFLSLNLTALNILPLPALDGGRLILLLVEKIKGSPLPSRAEKTINSAGFAILLFVILAITIKDIANLF